MHSTLNNASTGFVRKLRVVVIEDYLRVIGRDIPPTESHHLQFAVVVSPDPELPEVKQHARALE